MDASAGEEATTATAEADDARTFGLLLLALDCTQASPTAAATLYHHGIVHVVYRPLLPALFAACVSIVKSV
jgi:hypothetical protein